MYSFNINRRANQMEQKKTQHLGSTVQYVFICMATRYPPSCCCDEEFKDHNIFVLLDIRKWLVIKY